MPLAVAFAGTPAFSVPTLRAIAAAGHRIVLVLTQPDRPAGRGLAPRPSPIKELALAAGYPIEQPVSLKTAEARASLTRLAPDVLVVVAYGLILPQAVLDIPRLGALNVHASLLPRWRGAAPIHRALLAGDSETGVAIMQMDAGLDTGAVLLEARTPIRREDTTGTLHDRLAEMGARLLVEALDAIAAGRALARPQPAEGVTYAAKIAKSEAEIDWHADALAIERQVRAFNPTPGAATIVHGVPTKIWLASAIEHASATPATVLAADADGIVVACGSGALRIDELQRAGAKRLRAAEFLRGSALHVGASLGSQ